jgi:hypothetical protein
MQQSDDEKLFDRMVEVHAKDWGIPKKYWHRAAVRDHVRFCHQLRKLQHEIESRSRKHHPDCGGSHHHDFWMSEEEIFRDHPSLIEKARYALTHNGRLPPPLLKPAISERYRCVELLLRCAIEVLEQGLNGEQIHTGYLKSKLGRAASYYGLDVVDSEQAD